MNDSGRPLPAGWRWVRLDGVCQVIAGQSPPGDTYRKVPEGLPFFQGKADFGLRHPVARTWCVSPTKVALPGDILVSVRAPVGPTNVADVECCIGRGLAAIRPRTDADRDFILASLQLFEKQLEKLGSGSTFGAIRINDLASLQIPLPPVQEQKRIAAILNEQMGAMDRARVAGQAQLEAAKALPAAYLRAIFSSPEAQGWPRKRLEELASGDNGFADGPFGSNLKTEHYTPTGARVVRLQNIGRGAFLDEDKVFVSLDHYAALTRHSVRAGDVIVAALGNGARPAGRACQVPEGFGRGIVKADCFRVRLSPEKVSPEYLLAYLNSPDVLARAADAMRGATRPRVTLSMLRQVEIVLPPVSDQRRVARMLNEQMTSAEQARKAIEEELDTINKLPAALLRQAFEGRL